MIPADRPLSPAVIEALTYWPGIVHAVAPTPVDLGVLPPLFNELLDEWPWWDRAWRVTRVEPARPCEIARDEPRAVSRFTEVTVPGTVSRDAGDTLPLSARVRWSLTSGGPQYLHQPRRQLTAERTRRTDQA